MPGGSTRYAQGKAPFWQKIHGTPGSRFTFIMSSGTIVEYFDRAVDAKKVSAIFMMGVSHNACFLYFGS
ncbi:hypothetical protein KDA_72760 [Dictyobacter alpinus]|uniref:Uncharacterized protein n=1 Tax=Dictyobacter alpinus TaxID=2014873 RepID=A0A402BKC9_9CHLR|nr:hypothetical protein KDA_72760 [Dictyobacter alpinus]